MLKTKIRGREYTVSISRLKGRTAGEAGKPSHKNPRIRLDRAMFEKPHLIPDLLEVAIHEALHACFWDIDEEGIFEAGRDIARFLKKIGVKCDPKIAKTRINQRRK